ncbi:hypothetical protein ABK040_005417 [Willaertia magna]
MKEKTSFDIKRNKVAPEEEERRNDLLPLEDLDTVEKKIKLFMDFMCLDMFNNPIKDLVQILIFKILNTNHEGFIETRARYLLFSLYNTSGSGVMSVEELRIQLHDVAIFVKNGADSIDIDSLSDIENEYVNNRINFMLDALEKSGNTLNEANFKTFFDIFSELFAFNDILELKENEQVDELGMTPELREKVNTKFDGYKSLDGISMDDPSHLQRLQRRNLTQIYYSLMKTLNIQTTGNHSIDLLRLLKYDRLNSTALFYTAQYIFKTYTHPEKLMKFERFSKFIDDFVTFLTHIEESSYDCFCSEKEKQSLPYFIKLLRQLGVYVKETDTRTLFNYFNCTDAISERSFCNHFETFITKEIIQEDNEE